MTIGHLKSLIEDLPEDAIVTAAKLDTSINCYEDFDIEGVQVYYNHTELGDSTNVFIKIN